MQHPIKNVQQAGEHTELKPRILGLDVDSGVSPREVKDKLVRRHFQRTRRKKSAND